LAHGIDSQAVVEDDEYRGNQYARGIGNLVHHSGEQICHFGSGPRWEVANRSDSARRSDGHSILKSSCARAALVN